MIAKVKGSVVSMSYEAFDELLFGFALSSIKDACAFNFKECTEAIITFGEQHADDPDFLFDCAECLSPFKNEISLQRFKTKFSMEYTDKCACTFATSSPRLSLSIQLNFADVFKMYQSVVIHYHQNIISKSSIPKYPPKNLSKQLEELQKIYSTGKCSLQSLIEIFTAFSRSGFHYVFSNRYPKIEIERLEGLMGDGLPAVDAWIQCIFKFWLCIEARQFDGLYNFLRETKLNLRSDTVLHIFSVILVKDVYMQISMTLPPIHVH